ncbi:multicopper oxidase family protein [Marinomonas colpomeniae]|uniref:multicopper oxidase family protein n=1 Tax=Marinomonas colpomeniae TaxID=2774408 RepID=UPI001F45B9B0|nr:multicopper oxidase family protein [Marinomonas colpomeniae]
MNRRNFIKSSMAIAIVGALPQLILAKQSSTEFDYELIIAPADVNIVPGGSTPALSFNGGYPSPVIRAKQHQPVRIRVINQLKEPTTIHWHGLRIPIDMDGVPFLSQMPIMPGDTFDYEFTPPDAGTFWYHPHMNSIEQLGKGLVGALIVEEAEKPDFDADLVLCMKNWHIKDDGSFTALTSPQNAFRMGTPGRIMTINGEMHPTYDVPAGGAIRIRFLNVDNTLVYDVNSTDPDAQIIAIDGNPIEQPITLENHLMAPGMRLDLGVMSSKEVGKSITFKHKNKPLVTLRSVASTATFHSLPALPLNPIPEPDLNNAETIKFAFEWNANITPIHKDGKVNYNFWTMNRRSWEGMSKGNIPAPLAQLERGKTYLFELSNLTQYHHPIHIHGHTFTVLKSNKKAITPFHSDTVLLGKNETVIAALVADNPGRWMYHCHIIEHLKTGFMGYVEVS